VLYFKVQVKAFFDRIRQIKTYYTRRKNMSKKTFPLSCAIMAAGISRRFQEPKEAGLENVNKLLVDFRGKPLLQWTLDCFAQLHCCSRIIVVREFDTGIIMPEDAFHIVWNNGKNLSQSVTIRHALMAVSDRSKGCLFAVGDQPFLTYSSVHKLCEVFRENPEKIISLSWKKQRGNPVIFPRSLFPELLHLEDGLTGRYVIDRHPELLRMVEANHPDELMDIDTRTQYINAYNGKLSPLFDTNERHN